MTATVAETTAGAVPQHARDEVVFQVYGEGEFRIADGVGLTNVGSWPGNGMSVYSMAVADDGRFFLGNTDFASSGDVEVRAADGALLATGNAPGVSPGRIVLAPVSNGVGVAVPTAQASGRVSMRHDGPSGAVVVKLGCNCCVWPTAACSRSIKPTDRRRFSGQPNREGDAVEFGGGVQDGTQGLDGFWAVSHRVKIEPLSVEVRVVLHVASATVPSGWPWRAAIEVRQKAGQVFVESHVHGIGEFAFQPIPFRDPSLVTPPQLQLGHSATDLEQVVFLNQGVHCSGLGFTAVTNSHSAGYDFPDRKPHS